MISYQYDEKVGTGHLIIFVEVEDVGNVVLRANLFMDDKEEYLDYEKEFSEMYKGVGIPGSEILFSDTSRSVFDFDYQIMKVLPGKSLIQEWEGSKEDYENIAEQIGSAVAKEYQLPIKGWGRISRDEDGNLVGQFKSLVSYLNAYLDHDLEILVLFGFISDNDALKISDFFSSSKMSVYFLRKMIDKVQFALKGERLAEKHIRLFREGIKRNGLKVEVLLDIF